MTNASTTTRRTWYIYPIGGRCGRKSSTVIRIAEQELLFSPSVSDTILLEMLNDFDKEDVPVKIYHKMYAVMQRTEHVYTMYLRALSEYELVKTMVHPH